MQTGIEKNSVRYSEWEQQVKGSWLFDEPVDIEPAFKPFFFSATPETFAAAQKKNGLFGKIAGAVKKLFVPRDAFMEQLAQIKQSPEAFAPAEAGAVTCLRIEWLTQNITPLLNILANCNYQLSFEIIASGNNSSFQLTCGESNVADLLQRLTSAGIQYSFATTDQLTALVDNNAAITDYGLREAFVKPVNVHTGSIAKAFIAAANGTDAALQILFKPVVNNWAENIMRAVADKRGVGITEAERETATLAKQKTAYPLYAVVIRTIVDIAEVEAQHSKAAGIEEAVIQNSKSPGNILSPCSNKNYHPVNHKEDVLQRQSHRVGVLLNRQELGTFVHMPVVSKAAVKKSERSDYNQ
ncbi:MAG: hypothetical protein QM731_19115 [Chitinophagaceae bacterium]